MKNYIFIIIVLLLSGCTTYEGAAYLKNDLSKMDCSENKLQKKRVNFKAAQDECMKHTVDDDYFKAGVSEATLTWIREVHRRTYQECMDMNGFSCSWDKWN